jgi:hypothetical protein
MEEPVSTCLDPDLRVHEWLERAQPAERYVLHRTERLDAVERVVGDLVGAKRVFFGAHGWAGNGYPVG